MKAVIIALRIIVALMLITLGCGNLSKPSNFYVAVGLLEITLGIIFLYHPAKSLIKKII
jgi:uncharacterized membrane protein HdeD (DUF308 family)